MATASITQPTLSQGDLVSTQYINKVKISSDGSLTVTATPLVGSNIITPVTTKTVSNSNTNQIVSVTKFPATDSTVSPSVISADTQGNTINPQPPGPPPPATEG